VGRVVVMASLVIALTALNLTGVRPSAIVTDAFTIGKLTALLFFVVGSRSVGLCSRAW